MFLSIICPLLFRFAQCSEMSIFVAEPVFNDLLLFNDFTLGPPSEKVSSDCARDCHQNVVCTRFSMSRDSNVCQLYGYVDVPDLETAADLPGQRYFILITERCPTSEGFVALPVVNLCIKVSLTPTVYADVVYQCNQLGGRPIVLEDEHKATAVLGYLQSIGQGSTWFYLGAMVPEGQSDNSYVWADGQPLVRDWWYNGEPNQPGVENCLLLIEQGLGDVGCDYQLPFICEIPQ